MAGPLEIALAEDRVVAERGGRLAPRRRERLLQLLGHAHDAHAAPAAARGGLDEKREADLLGCPARQDGDAGLARGLLRRELVAARPERRRRRADPGQAPPRARPRRAPRSRRGSRTRDGRRRHRTPARRGRARPARGRTRSRRARLPTRAWSAPRSSGAATATVSMPSARQARKIRSAISPRLATSSRRIRRSLGSALPKDLGDSARSALRFLV